MMIHGVCANGILCQFARSSSVRSLLTNAARRAAVKMLVSATEAWRGLQEKRSWEFEKLSPYFLSFVFFLFCLSIGEAWDECRFFVAGDVVFVCFHLNIGETWDGCRFLLR